MVLVLEGSQTKSENNNKVRCDFFACAGLKFLMYARALTQSCSGWTFLREGMGAWPRRYCACNLSDVGFVIEAFNTHTCKWIGRKLCTMPSHSCEQQSRPCYVWQQQAAWEWESLAMLFAAFLGSNLKILCVPSDIGSSHA